MGKKIVTMGDPRGVGPDLIVLARANLGSSFSPLVIGSRKCLETRARKLGLPNYDGEVIEPEGTPADYMNQAGEATLGYLNLATKILLEDDSPGLLVTGPINKSAMKKAGFTWPGHTEYLAHRAQVERVHMLMANPKLRVLLTTVHEPLSRVPSLITNDRVRDAIVAAGTTCYNDFDIARPKIAIAGLNPHAGEEGMFGDEEPRVLRPAMEEAHAKLRTDGIQAELFGPVPPDTVFFSAVLGEYDMVVAMYHDQGLVAVKTTAFHTTVNVTLGLPFVRTSPDHGTAFSIAGTNKVNPSSFITAWDLGCTLLSNRIESYG